jgi:hypothetical protein
MRDRELKRIRAEAVPLALDKAEHYRTLSNPEQAESICLDVLSVDPTQQRALVVLILAITDQLAETGAEPSAQRARDCLARLTDPYQRAYYTGIVCEREARAFLRRGMPGVMAYHGLRQAMEWYEKAEALRPAGNDDPILRWNSCLRTIQRERMNPPSDEGQAPLE